MSLSQDEDPLTYEIIGAAIEVHRALGAGLLEELYEAAFCVELEHRKLKYERQRHIDVVYKGRNIGDMYVDIVVEDTVVVELKSVKRLESDSRCTTDDLLETLASQKRTAYQLQCSVPAGRHQADCFLDLFPLCSLCLCGETLLGLARHSGQSRGAENTLRRYQIGLSNVLLFPFAG